MPADIATYAMSAATIAALNELVREHHACTLNDIHERARAAGVSLEGAAELVGNSPPMVLTAEHFACRQRQKNPVPWYDRCGALKAGGERCTRRRQETTLFCGTHVKGQPHGCVSTTGDAPAVRVTVSSEDVRGILHWFDDAGNVYSQEDVYANIPNPRIVARYTRDAATGVATIHSD